MWPPPLSLLCSASFPSPRAWKKLGTLVFPHHGFETSAETQRVLGLQDNHLDAQTGFLLPKSCPVLVAADRTQAEV